MQKYKFVPESCTLNNIYIPQHEPPRRREYRVFGFTDNEPDDVIEADIDPDNTNYSMLTFKGQGPFFDLSDYDEDSESFYWRDEREFPYRFQYVSHKAADGVTEIFDGWKLTPIWGIGYTQGVDLIRTAEELEDVKPEIDDTHKYGGYPYIDLDVGGESIRVWRQDWLVVSVNGRLLKDCTDWRSVSHVPLSMQRYALKSDAFMYDYESRAVIVGMPLEQLRGQQVTIRCKVPAVTETNVQYTLHANQPNPSITPIVKWYILKLQGQDLTV